MLIGLRDHWVVALTIIIDLLGLVVGGGGCQQGKASPNVHVVIAAISGFVDEFCSVQLTHQSTHQTQVIFNS